MEAFPQKVRDLVLDAYAEGLATREICRRYKVSPSYARKARQRQRERGVRTAYRQKHGPDPKLSDADRRDLADLVAQTPGATVKQLHARLNRPVGVSTVVRALYDMKLTLKKSRFMRRKGIGRT
jgi:transposase